MKVKSVSLAAALVAISVSSAMAGFSTNQAGPVPSASSRGTGAGTVGTNNGSFVVPYAGPEFTAGSITVVGTLTSTGIASWASEAVFEICNPSSCVALAGGALNAGATSFTTVAVNQTAPLPAGLTGTSIGNWTFEAFESYNDGGNAVDANWSALTVTINDATPPPPAFSGNFTGTPNTLTNGVAAAGTTVWNFGSPQPGLTDGAGEGAAVGTGTRYGASTFSAVGNEVGYKIVHPGGDLFGDLTGIASDLDLHLLNASGIPLTGTLDSSENGGTTAEHIELLAAPAGTYYLVVDTFGAANNGSGYSIVYTPEPATLTLLAFGVVGLIRRRR